MTEMDKHIEVLSRAARPQMTEDELILVISRITGKEKIFFNGKHLEHYYNGKGKWLEEALASAILQVADVYKKEGKK